VQGLSGGEKFAQKRPLQKLLWHPCSSLIAAKSPFWADPRIIFFQDLALQKKPI
jgi:hypothetical protein